MKTFRNFILEEKKGYVGNCVNSFDEHGHCEVRHLPYRNTTDFAQGEEKAKHISKDEFEKHAHVPSHLEKLHNSKHVVHMHDSENNVHMMYDTKKDVHHFFT